MSVPDVPSTLVTRLPADPDEPGTTVAIRRH